jgi:hypothetical protein
VFLLVYQDTIPLLSVHSFLYKRSGLVYYYQLQPTESRNELLGPSGSCWSFSKMSKWFIWDSTIKVPQNVELRPTK